MLYELAMIGWAFIFVGAGVAYLFARNKNFKSE